MRGCWNRIPNRPIHSERAIRREEPIGVEEDVFRPIYLGSPEKSEEERDIGVIGHEDD